MPSALTIFLLIQISKAKLDSIGSGFAFRGWNYAIALVTLFSHVVLLWSDLASFCYFGTDCGITFVNRKWLYKYVLDKKILKMAFPLKVHGIRASKPESNKFVSIPIYFLRIDKHKQLVYTCIYYKMYMFDNLKANMLMRNDIVVSKNIIID